ncbi:MAG TPA: TatD family hydrolase [Syntrophales bacterium]|nr:TatD family hydrolase [Syntrophales bacterium]
MYIDSHAHLEMKEFDRDRAKVVKRALEAGVEYIVTVGTTLEDCRKALAIAKQHENVFAVVGIHPHEVKSIDPETYDTIRSLASADKVVAYGEIGLDFFRNLSPKDVQIKRFGEQLELAEELDLPVVIHDREAHRETLEMLKGWKGKKRGVVHCFSGDRTMAMECIDLGFYISIPGPVTFPKSEKMRDVVKGVPLNRLLIETDAPYLTPHPYRGKRNEPAYVVFTARKIAEVKGITPEEVGKVTSQNAKDIFGLPIEIA